MDDRLGQKGFDGPTRISVIGYLKAHNALDDRRLARAWVEKRLMDNPRSKALLKSELLAKGIAEEICDSVITEAGIDDRGLAERIIEEAKRTASAISEEKMKQRIMGLLIRRGFDPELAQELVERS